MRIIAKHTEHMLNQEVGIMNNNLEISLVDKTIHVSGLVNFGIMQINAIMLV